MESLATLVLKRIDFELKGDCFACEAGALAILDKGYPLKCALGDFDSVTEEEFSRIQNEAESIVRYSSHKDASDSELAIEYLLDKGYQKIIIYGGLGGRSDHQHVNLLLAAKYPQVIFKDGQQELYSVCVGKHVLTKEDYDVFSVFSFKEAIISLSDCEYPLDQKKIDVENTLTLSNAWINQKASLTVHQGCCVVIKSKNR